MQIGELTTRLTDEFKETHSEISWRAIKLLRNMHVHEYETVNPDRVWNTLTEDIPALKEQLAAILETMNED